MVKIFQRPKLAASMAQQLLRPGVLDEGLRSGLFLSGIRRTGKTTFLLNDLIPALEDEGALVIYVDLWSDVRASPSHLVHRAIRESLDQLQTPASALFKKLKKIASAEVAAHGLKFNFSLDKLGEKNGATLANALTEVVDQACAHVVLIVDEIQHALSNDDGAAMMLALKSARDAINSRPDTPGHFLFIGTGSHRALVNELVTRRNQAFAGATSVAYPVLNGEFVEYVLRRLAVEQPAAILPSLAAATRAFNEVGNRPEELIKGLRILLARDSLTADPDAQIAVIAATLRMSAADAELIRLDQLGGLATAIFDRIATSSESPRGLFSAEAVTEYSEAVGHEVRVEEVQPAVNDLLAANLIMRRSHGIYGVSDPFVQDTWLERKRLAGTL